MDTKIIYTFNSLPVEQTFVGPMNQNLALLNSLFDVKLFVNNNCLLMEEALWLNLDKRIQQEILAMVEVLTELTMKKSIWNERDITHIATLFKNTQNINKEESSILSFYLEKKVILSTFEGKKVYAKTYMQKKYLDALENSVVVFATGAAGTGKTYLAVAYAIKELKQNSINRIIITRPAVEAGEKLGFLPGDLKEKVDPYLIPIYDAVDEFLGVEQAAKYIEKGIIEVAPLAYMRGRTLDHAMVILDEAQNTTSNQMKMFLTRLGFHSKMVITGDMTQIDLPNQKTSGLVEAIRLLKDIDEIKMIRFDASDVMRHPVVSKIIHRYEGENHDNI